MKLNDKLISTIIGAVTVIIIGILVFNYFSGVEPVKGNSDDYTNQGQVLRFEDGGWHWKIFKSFDEELNIVCYATPDGIDCIKLENKGGGGK